MTGVKLEGNHVLVTFRAKDCFIGNASSASIQIKTLLGEKYLAIDPAGDKQLDPGTAIPLDRTVALKMVIGGGRVSSGPSPEEKTTVGGRA